MKEKICNTADAPPKCFSTVVLYPSNLVFGILGGMLLTPIYAVFTRCSTVLECCVGFGCPFWSRMVLLVFLASVVVSSMCIRIPKLAGDGLAPWLQQPTNSSCRWLRVKVFSKCLLQRTKDILVLMQCAGRSAPQGAHWQPCRTS